MRKLALIAAVLALAAVGIAACGGDDDGASGDESAATDEPAATTETPADDAGGGGGAGAGGSQADLSANPGGAVAYETASLTATGPNVTIALTNESVIPHNVRVEDAGGNDLGGTDIFSEGMETASLDLEPGEYTFFCSVPGHRQQGMEGTLTVE